MISGNNNGTCCHAGNRPYDLVLYGASGFTGAYVLEAFAKSDEFGRMKFAVAGRSEAKLRKTLHDVGLLVGKDLSGVAIIVADSGDAQSLGTMARQTRVIINVVGPYRLHGEPVVKAAVENGASHVDISGEPAFLERMQMQYDELAKQNGVFVVGACGWDSIPCDLGVHWLKQHFSDKADGPAGSDGGLLSHVEAFPQINYGPAGYSFNAGTYQTLVLGIWQAKNDGLGRIRKAIMPERPPKSKWSRVPRRRVLWWNEALKSYCLPFLGADKSIVQRSQYHDATANGGYPATAETYILVRNRIWAMLLMLWLALFQWAVQWAPTRSLLQKYPGLCSGFLFSEHGPTRDQAKQASFTYWFVGWGWPVAPSSIPGSIGTAASSVSIQDLDNRGPPERVVVARCDGPDAGYIATAGCVLSAAFTLVRDKDKLSAGRGGVFTTAAAFGGTGSGGIYDRLAKFGVTFRVDPSVRLPDNYCSS